ncbi:MAG TPA: fatty acid desaturase [Kiloniellales bacterium]|nr:fatty acid desaturase [Kiloniellales bacterium]
MNGPSDSLDTAALKALARPSDTRGLMQLAGHLGLLALTGTGVLLALGSWWLIAALPAHGLVLIFLFAPLHETIHRTAFRTRPLNDTVAGLCGFLLLLPPRWFRAFHLAHHRFTRDPARDPELAEPEVTSRLAYLRHVSGLPTWTRQLELLVRQAAGIVDSPFVPARETRAVTTEARVFLVSYAAIFGFSIIAGSTLALWLWIVPALLGQPILRLFLLAEHHGCPRGPTMLDNTRTTASNRLVRFLSWNMPYHAEHHAYPALPFHALPAAHARLGPRIAVRAPGYAAVQRDIWRRLSRSESQKQAITV